MDIFSNLLDWHCIPYTWGFVLMFFYTRSIFFTYSLYWHRSCAHKHFTIHPGFQHLLRFWLWVNTTLWFQGHLTRFTAEHTLHHIKADTELDPFTPKKFSLMELFTYEHRPGAARYISAEDIEKYGDPTVEPNDTATLFYKKHQFKGVWISRFFWTILLGPIGLLYSMLLPYFIQYFGTFVGDYFWHKVGYRHPKSTSEARNFWPWPTLEGLHSNHHVYPGKPNVACRWWEIDFFYWQTKLLALFGLVKFHKKS